MSRYLRDDGEFVEIADYKLDGKTVTHLGAQLVKKNGKIGGILYAHGYTEIGTWDGLTKVRAESVKTKTTNRISRDGYSMKNAKWKFTWGDKNFIGIQWNCDWSDIVRVKEV